MEQLYLMKVFRCFRFQWIFTGEALFGSSLLDFIDVIHLWEYNVIESRGDFRVNSVFREIELHDLVEDMRH